MLRRAIRPLYRGLMHIIRGLILAADRLMGRNQFIKATHFVQERLDLTLTVEGIRFESGAPISFFRAQTLMIKEPETIAWIEDFIGSEDVFYDIGANIGVFSLYAATKRQCRVFAFEPSAENLAELNRNIWLNGLGNRITAFGIALHDRTAVDVLNMSRMGPGRACHAFGAAIDGWGREFEPVFRQGVMGTSLDSFVYDYGQPVPNHIKLDVDGNEHLIVRGMGRVLADPRLRSIAIELNFQDRLEIDQAVQKTIENGGFHRLSDTRYGPSRVNPNMTNYFFVRN